MSATGTVTTHLRELADDRLFRNNAFRITGLAVDAGSRHVREAQKRAAAAAAVGAELPAAGDDHGVPPLDPPPGAERIRAAFDVLADPRRRLVHELFWFWGEDTTACRCEPRVHELHDTAVRVHATLLHTDIGPADVGTQAEDLRWETVHRSWADVVEADPWAHVRHRIRVVDDPRQLAMGAVDELRAELPRALAATAVGRATRSDDPGPFVDVARRWLSEPDLDDLVMAAVGPRIERIREQLGESRRRLDSDETDAVAERLLAREVPDLNWLDDIAPHRRFRRVAALRTEAGILLNNCAVVWSNRGDYARALPLFRVAAELVADEQDRRRFEANLRDTELAERIDAALAPFGLSGVDGGVQELADRMMRALDRRRYAEADRMAQALLAVVDGPQEREMLQQVRRRVRAARVSDRHRGGSPYEPLRPLAEPVWPLLLRVVALTVVLVVLGGIVLVVVVHFITLWGL